MFFWSIYMRTNIFGKWDKVRRGFATSEWNLLYCCFREIIFIIYIQMLNGLKINHLSFIFYNILDLNHRSTVYAHIHGLFFCFFFWKL